MCVCMSLCCLTDCLTAVFESHPSHMFTCTSKPWHSTPAKTSRRLHNWSTPQGLHQAYATVPLLPWELRVGSVDIMVLSYAGWALSLILNVVNLIAVNFKKITTSYTTQAKNMQAEPRHKHSGSNWWWSLTSHVPAALSRKISLKTLSWWIMVWCENHGRLESVITQVRS